MIKESYNLIGLEAQLITTNHKWYSQILPYVDGYLHVKNIWYSLIPCTYIDDPRTLQSDWMRCKTHRTQPKVVVSDPSFHWGEMSNKKCKVLIDYFQWYWWSKNAEIWLSERILGNNWRTRFFLDMLFSQNHKNTVVHHF